MSTEIAPVSINAAAAEIRSEVIDAVYGPEIPDHEVHKRLVAWSEAAAPNSLRALRSDLKVADQFQRTRHRPTLPLSPTDLYMLIEERAATGSAKSSISRLVSSMVRIHSLAQLPPCVDDLVRWKLKQVRRADSREVRQAHGLRLKGEVADVINDQPKGPSLLGILASLPDDPRGVRDRALITVGYDAGLRRSELVRIKVAHLERLANNEMSLFIPRSKTDQAGEGARAWLSSRAVEALDAWLKLTEISEGYVFRSLSYRVSASEHLTEGTVSRILKERAAEYLDRLVEDEQITKDLRDQLVRSISGHSLRVGCDQDLFAAGVDIGAIMQGLRWTNPKQPLAYARHLAPATSKLAAKMRQIR